MKKKTEFDSTITKKTILENIVISGLCCITFETSYTVDLPCDYLDRSRSRSLAGRWPFCRRISFTLSSSFLIPPAIPHSPLSSFPSLLIPLSTPHSPHSALFPSLRLIPLSHPHHILFLSDSLLLTSPSRFSVLEIRRSFKLSPSITASMTLSILSPSSPAPKRAKLSSFSSITTLGKLHS